MSGYVREGSLSQLMRFVASTNLHTELDIQSMWKSSWGAEIRFAKEWMCFLLQLTKFDSVFIIFSVNKLFGMVVILFARKVDKPMIILVYWQKPL